MAEPCPRACPEDHPAIYARFVEHELRKRAPPTGVIGVARALPPAPCEPDWRISRIRLADRITSDNRDKKTWRILTSGVLENRHDSPGTGSGSPVGTAQSSAVAVAAVLTGRGVRA